MTAVSGLTERTPRLVGAAAVLVVACVAQFMVLLDVSVVNVALPAIRSELGFGPATLQWVVNAYTVAAGGFLLLGGRTADVVGPRRVLIGGLVLFSVASVAGGAAQSPAWLLAARSAQGLGGAFISPATLALLLCYFPEGPARTRAVAIWTGFASTGTAAGGIVGGLLTSLASWRWTLFVNAPIALFAIAVATRRLGDDRSPEAPPALDVAGAVSATAGVCLLVLATVSLAEPGRPAAVPAGGFAAGGVLLAAFLWLQRRERGNRRAPLLPLRLFRSRTVAAANVSQLLLAGAFFSLWYLMSLILQTVHGYSAIATGLAFVPMTAAIIVGTQASGRAVNRAGVRSPLVVAVVTAGAGFAWLSTVSTGAGYATGLLLPSLVVALGLGAALPPLAIAATTGVPPGDSGIASGLLNTTRQMGGALGLATLVAVSAASMAGHRHEQSTPEAVAGMAFSHALVVAAAMCGAAAVAACFLPRRPGLGAPPAPPLANDPDVPVDADKGVS